MTHNTHICIKKNRFGISFSCAGLCFCTASPGVGGTCSNSLDDCVILFRRGRTQMNLFLPRCHLRMSSFATFRFQRGTDLVGFAFGQLQLLHAPVTKPSVPRWAWKEIRMTCVKLCHKRRRTTCYRQKPTSETMRTAKLWGLTLRYFEGSPNMPSMIWRKICACRSDEFTIQNWKNLQNFLQMMMVLHMWIFITQKCVPSSPKRATPAQHGHPKKQKGHEGSPKEGQNRARG